MKKSAISFLIALLIAFAVAQAWDRSARILTTLDTDMSGDAQVRDTAIFYVDMEAYNIERLVANMRFWVSDSVGTVFVYAQSSFDRVNWTTFYGVDTIDSGSYTWADPDSHAITFPAYCDTVSAYAPYTRWLAVLAWDLAHANSADTFDSFVRFNWDGFFED